ncbi:MAG: glycosyltransferase family 2 protein [Microgenomates group bacterium]
MKSKPLTLIILTGNSHDLFEKSLTSCTFADEIILISNATDNTHQVAKSIYPNIKIYQSPQPFNFSTARNLGLKHATGKWILYIDSDEVVTPSLKKQILEIIDHPSKYTNYDLPRANYFLGHRVRYGGTYPDYVKRLFLRRHLIKYVGILHEQPQVTGPSGVLNSNLLHYTHRHLQSMLSKSIDWTQIEAQLLHQAHHPPVVWWRFIRMLFTKLWQRLVLESMWRDGIVGWISLIFEVYDTYMIYAYLYELQHA